jgi:glycosyltransferase involved in cell wall biosynthesis
MHKEHTVCFVNHSAELGGAEYALMRLLSAMDQTRWHPVIVLSEDGPLAEVLRSRSLEVYVLALDPGVAKARKGSLERNFWNRPAIAFVSAQYVARLARFFRERGVDIVHTNSMKAHVLGGLAAATARIPLLWHLRDSLHPACLPSVALGVMRFLARNLPKHIVSVSQSVASDALGAEKLKRCSVVYDGLDQECFENPVALPVLGKVPPWRVGIAGRLCAWKGQHVFLEAAAKLLERGWNIQFEILGGPLFGQEPYAERLINFISSCKLDENVTCSGQVSDVPRRIRDWDLLVHASTLPDPCPNVVLEAMAAGVPVVGANSGGVPELLDGGRCGALFAPDNPEALCAAIVSLLNNPSQRRAFAQLARLKALESFRSERVAREVERVWELVVDPRAYSRRCWPIIEGSSETSSRRRMLPQLRQPTVC